MSAQYQRFLKVLEKWPAEKSKIGRWAINWHRNTLKSWMFVLAAQHFGLS